MIYVFGIFGFIGGFILGQGLLLYLLRSRPREELLNNRMLKFTYGLLNWVIAGVCSYGCVYFYHVIFAA